MTQTGVLVQRGPPLDGLGEYYRQTITESDAEPVDVVQRCVTPGLTSWCLTYVPFLADRKHALVRGLAKLGRDHHRCHQILQDREGPPWRPGAICKLLLHEEPAGAVRTARDLVEEFIRG